MVLPAAGQGRDAEALACTQVHTTTNPLLVYLQTGEGRVENCTDRTNLFQTNTSRKFRMQGTCRQAIGRKGHLEVSQIGSQRSRRVRATAGRPQLSQVHLAKQTSLSLCQWLVGRTAQHKPKAG